MGRHLVIVGGGHAHLTVLARLRDFTGAGHRVTLVSPSPYHYYSGMGPGMLSGIYRPQEIRFHVGRMARDRGAEFITALVSKIDPVRKILHLSDGSVLEYDIASFNTGSDVSMDLPVLLSVEGVFSAKPVDRLYAFRRAVLEGRFEKKVRIVVVGGGPAGVEVSSNARMLLDGARISGSITLVGGRRVLGGFPPRVRQLAIKSLASKKVRILEGITAVSIRPQVVELSDGNTLPRDFVVVAVGVRPSTLYRDSGLPVGSDGGMLVNAYLQSVRFPELFGGGDCICLEGHRLARVGVYAVRQNRILHHNLMSALEGGDFLSFHPGGDYLLVMNMGEGKGIAWKKGIVWNGRLAFLLKDLVDRRFVRKFQVSGEKDELE